jgi:hypothetical protein
MNISLSILAFYFFGVRGPYAESHHGSSRWVHEMYLPVDAPPSYLVAHLGDEEYYDALTTLY